MPHPDVIELSLPCEHPGCAALVAVWCHVNDWLDGSITCYCPAHRTPTSTP